MKKTKVIGFRVTDEEFKKIECLQQKFNVNTVKQVIKLLLQAYFEGKDKYSFEQEKLPVNICKTTGEPLKEGYGCFKTVVSCHHIRIDGIDW